MKLSRIVLLTALVGCGVESSVVGGRCLDGFTLTGDQCVSLTGSSGGSSGDNAFGSGAPGAPSESSSSSGTGGSSGLLPDGGTGATTSSISVTTVEVPATLDCAAPLVACRGACIAVATDFDNCGACGKICPSNICIDGECQGALAGDVIVLGHDYASSWSSSAQAKMLANAVSIPTTDPIRVLAFDGDHPGASAERTLISSTVRFRGVAYSNANDVALEASDLARKYDVVLIHGAGSSPAELGARWSSALETFTKKGGVVVALDDGTSDIPTLVRASGLLSIDGHVALATGTHVDITAPNDAVGVQVLSPYAPSGATVGFFGVATSPDVTVVARANDELSSPVAVHRFVR